MKARTSDSGTAPRKCDTAFPSLNAITSGSSVSVRGGDFRCSSEFTFASLNRPPYSRASFSRIGFNADKDRTREPEIDDYRCGLRSFKDLTLESIVLYVNSVCGHALTQCKA